MQPTKTLDEVFTQEYEGFKAARFRSAVDVVALENVLRTAELSYQVKILRSKKRGREFIVMLLEA